MKKSVSENFSNKNKWSVLAFFVSFSLFFSVNVFGYKFFKKEYVTAQKQKNCVSITAVVYNYSKTNYGYFESCKISGVDENNIPYKLFEFQTPENKKTGDTNLMLRNKEPKVEIGLDNFIKPSNQLWLEKYNANLFGTVPNMTDLAITNFTWKYRKAHPKVCFITFMGKWNTGTESEYITEVINVKIIEPGKMIKLNDQKENIDAKEINPVEVYGESDAVVVKCAESGATIKICNESGVEIKSVVANSNIERINLPANQLYLIHIGKSQYKVAL